MRIPGLEDADGGDIMVSDAAIVCQPDRDMSQRAVPMSLLVLLIEGATLSSIGSCLSGVMVEVEVERPPSEFFRGPRWVSLNSVQIQQASCG